MIDFTLLSGELELLLASVTFRFSGAERKVYRAIRDGNLEGAMASYPLCRTEYKPDFYRRLKRLRYDRIENSSCSK